MKLKGKVTVVDYGVGNLFSVQRALQHVGAENVVLSDSPADIEDADRLVLPGVGAFADGMRGIEERGLREPIVRFAASGKPLLGICLGMQMLASESEEFGVHRGLDLIPGRVRHLSTLPGWNPAAKVPNIGWRGIAPPAGQGWERTSLQGLEPGHTVYLVHSYGFVPEDPQHILAVCRYGGATIAAGVHRGNITGFQFHPEKSGPVTLDILTRFLMDGEKQ